MLVSRGLDYLLAAVLARLCRLCLSPVARQLFVRNDDNSCERGLKILTSIHIDFGLELASHLLLTRLHLSA